MHNIKEFYDRIQFPGHYSQQGLEYHMPHIRNPYLNFIDGFLHDGQTIIDIGCGTGLLTNLFAQRYPRSQFSAIDFADGVNYAKKFAQDQGISNAEFQQQDLLTLDTQLKYDVVLCQGVLHHIPDVLSACEKLKTLVAPGGTLLIGVYHPWGKIIKTIVDLDYYTPILEQDQEHNPYETSYTKAEIRALFHEFELLHHYPSWFGLTGIPAMINSISGGLIVYAFTNH